jgi:hypothetical protein
VIRQKIVQISRAILTILLEINDAILNIELSKVKSMKEINILLKEYIENETMKYDEKLQKLSNYLRHFH